MADSIQIHPEMRPQSATNCVSIFIPWFPTLLPGFQYYSVSTTLQLPLKPLLIRVNEVHESLDVSTIGKASRLFAHLEPGLHFRVIFFRIVEHTFAVGGFD